MTTDNKINKKTCATREAIGLKDNITYKLVEVDIVKEIMNSKEFSFFIIGDKQIDKSYIISHNLKALNL